MSSFVQSTEEQMLERISQHFQKNLLVGKQNKMNIGQAEEKLPCPSAGISRGNPDRGIYLQFYRLLPLLMESEIVYSFISAHELLLDLWF